MRKSTPIVMGVAAALFFALTFIVNRLMSVSGGSWIWSSSLRFFWMLPILFVIVYLRGGIAMLLREMNRNKSQWLLWSTVGFGLFYAPLTYSAAFSPSWLLASTWQVTIVAGMIIAPLISQAHNSSKLISNKSIIFSIIIIIGIGVMQVGQAQAVPAEALVKCIVPVVVAAFAYPLGNRKMMQVTKGHLDVFQRLLGMVMCSIPFWLLLTGYEFLFKQTLPGNEQLIQTLLIAVFSGVIATALFFAATDRVGHDQSKLAAVEATQATEVIFAVIGEVIVLGAPLPDLLSGIGILLVITGMVLHSFKAG